MKKNDFQSVVYKEGKYYVAQCLDVDVSSFGKSEQKALDALTEALELYFEDNPTQKIERAQNPKVHTLHLQHA
jgi:predicted RNase H-like HicB family nuclease